MERSDSLENYKDQGELPKPDEINCDLHFAHTCLKNGYVQDDDVDLEKYLNAYKELYKFFILLGKAFEFVASDLNNKIQILVQYRQKSDTGSNYSTVKSMMAYESSNDLLEKKNFVSGSRTLLRLHRGLDFVQQFLGEVYKLQDSEKIGSCCKASYDRTLANFHSWAIRNVARAAMVFLPTKDDLLKKISRNEENGRAKIVTIMPDLLDEMKITYDRVHTLYTINNLHNLS